MARQNVTAGPSSTQESAYFIACDKFEGARQGYAFKNDDTGLGYYKDIPLAERLKATAELQKAKPTVVKANKSLLKSLQKRGSNVTLPSGVTKKAKPGAASLFIYLCTGLQGRRCEACDHVSAACWVNYAAWANRVGLSALCCLHARLIVVLRRQQGCSEVPKGDGAVQTNVVRVGYQARPPPGQVGWALRHAKSSGWLHSNSPGPRCKPTFKKP